MPSIVRKPYRSLTYGAFGIRTNSPRNTYGEFV